MNAQLVIDHRIPTVGRPHAAGAHHVIHRGPGLAGKVQQFLVGLIFVAGHFFLGHEGSQGGGRHHLPPQADAVDQHPLVTLVRQVVGLDARRIEGTGRAGLHAAPAFRPALPDAQRHARPAIQQAHHAAAEAGRRKNEFQVGTLDLRPATPVGVGHGGAQRQDVGAPPHPFDELADEPGAEHHFVDADHIAQPRHQTDAVMVLQVLPHARQIGHQRHAQRFNEGTIPHAGDLQELGRTDCPGGQDDLTVGPDGLFLPPGTAPDAAHANGAGALEQDAADMGARADFHIRTLHGRLQEGPGRTAAPSVVDGPLQVAAPRVDHAVVIVGERDAQFGQSVDEGVTDGVRPVLVGDVQAAGAPAKAVVPHADLAFGTHEIRQDLQIGPARIASRCPVVVVLSLPAHVRQAVDGAGATQHLALRQPEAPVHHRPGLHGVVPGQAAAVHVPDIADRQVDQRAPVTSARLQHADTGPGGTQAIGQQATCRSGTHHHIVEPGVLIRPDSHYPLRNNPPESTGAKRYTDKPSITGSSIKFINNCNKTYKFTDYHAAETASVRALSQHQIVAVNEFHAFDESQNRLDA